MAEKNKKGKMTLDKLALMVGNGFNAVDKRFEQVDKRFEQVDKRFGQVDKRFGQIDKRFEDMDGRFDVLENKVDRIESELIGVVNKVENLDVSLNREIKQVKKRVDKLENAVFVKS
ncbi:MAG: hypothetical protein HYT61_03750 [Candidatus Yanofskybacteria bacterium]|nr:hypothetical protein [Candidatus Yanofskybacteria bacterium]